MILSRLDDFSNSIEWYFLQFYDLLVAGTDHPLNSGSEIPNSVAEIAFVFSARGTFIAASLIAAVRLNREEIKSSPIVYSKIADSIRLAEMIQARLRG